LEALGELAEEAEVEVDLAVERAVERPVPVLQVADDEGAEVDAD
jgi:hypothetical protein